MFDDKKELEILAANVKAERSRKRMSQEKLAELIDMTRDSVSNIETMKQAPSALVVLHIAKALEIDISKLYEGL